MRDAKAELDSAEGSAIHRFKLARDYKRLSKDTFEVVMVSPYEQQAKVAT
jgi:hypothetical protein